MSRRLATATFAALALAAAATPGIMTRAHAATHDADRVAPAPDHRSRPTPARPSAKEILLSRPLVPRDHALFHTAFYPDGPPLAPAAGSPPTENQVSQMLAAYLAEEYPGNPAARTAAEAVYTDPTAQSKIPSPSLRAALAALSGTFAAPAIDHILHAQAPDSQPAVTSVTFASLPANVYGFSTSDASGHTQIEVDQDQDADNPFLFTAILAHEALHQDQANGSSYEEATAHSFEVLVYFHQLVRHPDLVSHTELSRFENSLALARLNSGRRARLGLFAANRNRRVMPGSVKNYRSFWDSFEHPVLTNTPGNALLGAYLANIGAASCSHATFSRAVLNCIDAAGDAGLGPSELVAAARALKFNTSVEQERSISLMVRKAKLTGKVAAATEPCRSKQTVVIDKLRHGRLKGVGTTRSSSSGAYALKLKRPSGRYRATLARTTIPGIGVCVAATSKPVNGH